MTQVCKRWASEIISFMIEKKDIFCYLNKIAKTPWPFMTGWGNVRRRIRFVALCPSDSTVNAFSTAWWCTRFM